MTVNGASEGQKPADLKLRTVEDDFQSKDVQISRIKQLLANDIKVKVAGVDADGVLRGKVLLKEKFLNSLESGFGMSSAIFGWDMHDVLYEEETSLANAGNGYEDFTAFIDLDSFRRLPFENDIAFFLLRFSILGKPVHADGRSIITSVTKAIASQGFRGLAGVELEFMNFQTPTEDGYGEGRPNVAAFLSTHAPAGLRPITAGAFGYSVSRPAMNKDYFDDIFDRSLEIGCPVEGWHTESGPGVYEAALAVSSIARIADNVSVFKLLCKSLGVQHGITPCFMAKPVQGLPGNSGHIHVSLTDLKGNNVFVRDIPDPGAVWSDITYFTDTGRYFLAGILDALPDIMPVLAPTINSYKRLIENYWAPVSVSWGFEDRLSSIRLISPPSCKPSATRLEIRVPGADIHPHYGLSAIFLAGYRGIQRKMEICVPPKSARPKETPVEPLPNSLAMALERFGAKGSIARELFGDHFVDFYANTRRHELKVWREAVTDWEVNRYIEIV